MIRCEICKENIAANEEDEDFMRHVEMGDIAEMFDPQNPVAGGVVHVTCGQSRNWAVS